MGVRGTVAALTVAGSLIGCGTGTGEEASACEQAMADAAAVDEMQDTVPDLYPAVEACGTVDEWTDAAEAHPDALDGADPETFLGNVCQNSELSDAELCAEVG